jgi:hypothetical protein
MSKLWVDTDSLKKRMSDFFSSHRSSISDFGSTVNQCFEAFVFVSLVNWYASKGWTVVFKNPGGKSSVAQLKYSTRGRPDNYTYAVCKKGKRCIQIRHGLRIATKSHQVGQSMPANVVLDVAVIQECDLSLYKTNDHVDNTKLITFAEAKHMPAFAELIAGFIGLVHEIAPSRLKKKRPYIGPLRLGEHLAPFLYVSGHLNPTAQGIVDTIRYRGYDIDIYDYESDFVFGVKLATMPALKLPKKVPARYGRLHRKTTV